MLPSAARPSFLRATEACAACRGAVAVLSTPRTRARLSKATHSLASRRGDLRVQEAEAAPHFAQRRRYSNAAATRPGPSTSPHVLDVLQARNLLQATTSSALRDHLGRSVSKSSREQGGSSGEVWVKRTIYAGVDPSADSLHVGNLLPLMALLWLAREGHTIIVLIGGATGSIGDPSGRSSERNALSPSELAHNVEQITAQVHAFFRNASNIDTSDSLPRLDVRVVNNAVWYEGMNVLRFLGEIGRHARVGVMMARDSVKSRLFASAPEGQASPPASAPVGLSFTEFSYQLLQAYDFHILNKEHECTVQIGGSDQMGNIMAGVDLVRRLKAAEDGKSFDTDAEVGDSAPLGAPSTHASPAYGLTLPLLTTSSGAKFGKSAGNAVWLDSSRLPDLDFYQFFLRTPDADVALYLRALTLAPLPEIQTLLDEHATSPASRLAQRRLAQELTKLVRGPEALRRAQIASKLLFECALADLSASQAQDALRDDPRLQVFPALRIEGGKGDASLTLLNFAHEVGLGQSKGALRRLMANGGLYLNDVQVRADRPIRADDLQGIDASLLVLRAGKTDHRVVIFKR